MKPATFALLLGGAAAIVWWEWPRTPPAAPSVAQVIVQSLPDDSAVHRLCDREVEALLHSDNLVEVTRAGIIVQAIPCGIERRL